MAVALGVQANHARNQADIARQQADARFRAATSLRLVSEAQPMLVGARPGGAVRAYQQLLAARRLAHTPPEAMRVPSGLNATLVRGDPASATLIRLMRKRPHRSAAETLPDPCCAAEAPRFLELLASLVQHEAGVTPAMIVALTIRADRYEPLQIAPQLAGVRSGVFDELKPLAPAGYTGFTYLIDIAPSFQQMKCA